MNIQDCIISGLHLTSVDNNGYCNHCGHQEGATYAEDKNPLALRKGTYVPDFVDRRRLAFSQLMMYAQSSELGQVSEEDYFKALTDNSPKDITPKDFLVFGEALNNRILTYVTKGY